MHWYTWTSVFILVDIIVAFQLLHLQLSSKIFIPGILILQIDLYCIAVNSFFEISIVSLFHWTKIYDLFTTRTWDWTHDHQITRYILTNGFIHLPISNNPIMIIWSLKCNLSATSTESEYMYCCSTHSVIKWWIILVLRLMSLIKHFHMTFIALPGQLIKMIV